jgi:hypothetical protein
MANLQQERFASMVRMLQTAYPKNWQAHLDNLGLTASPDLPPADFDPIMERVSWMVRQSGIKHPAAWIKFDMNWCEAASASVEPGVPPKVAARQYPVELEPVKLGTVPAKTSGASPSSSKIASALVEPVRPGPVELKPVRLGPSGAFPPASETEIKEPAARIACDMSRVKAASASAEPKAPLRIALPVAVRQNPAEVEPVNLRPDSRETSDEPPVELETAIVIARLLSQARMAIEADNKREAVAAVFMARERYGVSQQEIAAAVGKSQSWVWGMLRWHRKGFKDTPFGPASKDARMAVRIGRLMARKLPRGLVRRCIRTRLAPNSVSSGVLVIKCPELPAGDVNGSEDDASGRPVGGGSK